MKLHPVRSVVLVLIILLCAGISPMVAAEEQSRVWKFSEIIISAQKADIDNGKYGCFNNPISVKDGSSSYTQTCCCDEKGDRASKMVTASWTSPPNTLTPGGKVHISGEISYDGADGTKVINSGEKLSAYFEEAGMLQHGYSTKTYGGEEVRASAAHQSPHGVLNGDLTVPKPGSDTGNPQKINLRYIVPGGAVNYIYTYTTAPLGSERPDYKSGLPCRCDQYVATNVETNNCLKYGKTEECTKCFWECNGAGQVNPIPERNLFTPGSSWSVQEYGPMGDFDGVWTMSDNGRTIDATWGGITDTIEVVSIDGNSITLHRKGNDGDYTGTLSSDKTRISGTASWYTAGQSWEVSLIR